MFYHDASKWSIEAGKFISITVGSAGMFAIHATNYSIYQRLGASMENSKGYQWEMISKNEQKIRFLESAYYSYIFGINEKGKLLYILANNDLDQVDEMWKPMNVNLDDNNSLSGVIFSSISCGPLSCWLLTANNELYSSKVLYSGVENMRWIREEGKF